jgi:D-beta-D-heptose 7-phosphate kinase/D-beta-D-heptose 1-phosphate adenosyltransferase
MTTLALLAGASLEEATTLANIAAGVVVSKIGTVAVTQEEVLDALED